MAEHHPGVAEVLARDWRKAAWFSARFGITEGRSRLGSLGAPALMAAYERASVERA